MCKNVLLSTIICQSGFTYLFIEEKRIVQKRIERPHKDTKVANMSYKDKPCKKMCQSL